MDETNLSSTMYDENEKEQSASLLNNNVSFDSTMEISAGEELTMPNVSFSLTESECLKLKQQTQVDMQNVKRSVLRDISLNVDSKPNDSTATMVGVNQICTENTTTTDDEITMEDTEPVISIEDTIEERQSEQTATTTSDEQVNTDVDPLAYFEGDIIELGRRCWTSSVATQNYTKGCYWSPDGTCLLVPVHQDGMHVMELPLDLYNTKTLQQERSINKLESAVHIPESGTVYDCIWYPHMNSQQPETCFWLATRQHEPINMWDAFDGRQRCSYSGYDQVDEVVSAISLAFSHDGNKIYAGYKKSIKIFDTNRPGRTYDEYPVKCAVSCIVQTLEHPHTVTCGNWKGYIQHFDLRCAARQGPLFTLGGHSGGITQLRYSRSNGSGDWQLYSGARKCSKLLLWDMRNYISPLLELNRKVDTNQRIQFDLSPRQQGQSWLVSGGTDGLLSVWNLSKVNEEREAVQLPLHEDCCNGVGFHPSLPIMASSSGQFHFLSPDSKLTKSNDNNSVMDYTTTPLQVEEVQGRQKPQSTDQKTAISYENAVLLLWLGKSTEIE